jgi:hypothetical protein
LSKRASRKISLNLFVTSRDDAMRRARGCIRIRRTAMRPRRSPGKKETKMSHIRDFMADLEIGAPLSSGRLTIYPLLTGRTIQPDYLTLDQALAKGLAHVSEVGEAGSVPELMFRNDGDLPVLLLDGEELVGAKQNRILNLTILVPPRSTLKIPVSCVEAKRWDYRSRHFTSSDRAYNASGRAEKMAHVSAAMASVGAPRSNQRSIWDSIAATASRLRVQSPTAAMSDVYEQQRPHIDHHVDGLAPQPRQSGAIFVVDGRVVGLDLFDAPATYARLAPKLVRSYAIDAIGDMPRRRDGAFGDARSLLQTVQSGKMQRFPAVGLGEDWRMEGGEVRSAALVYDRAAVHVCAFVS